MNQMGGGPWPMMSGMGPGVGGAFDNPLAVGRKPVVAA